MGTLLDWTPEEAEDNILGAGADCWDWYVNLGEQGDGFVVEMVDPDNDGATVERIFTADEYIQVAEEIVAGKREANERIRGYIKNDDIDADAGDCILQILLFGTVVYG